MKEATEICCSIFLCILAYHLDFFKVSRPIHGSGVFFFFSSEGYVVAFRLEEDPGADEIVLHPCIVGLT